MLEASHDLFIHLSLLSLSISLPLSPTWSSYRVFYLCPGWPDHLRERPRPEECFSGTILISTEQIKYFLTRENTEYFAYRWQKNCMTKGNRLLSVQNIIISHEWYEKGLPIFCKFCLKVWILLSGHAAWNRRLTFLWSWIAELIQPFCRRKQHRCWKLPRAESSCVSAGWR